ncbi:NAD-dependent epimerase/dehydratase family protein [Phycisphaerales bacterium AB-hyl4]|uniref:NAD-dependent epimerase/dehydratase family protein n=1 Tax=Natronomicrosphaera hydrolytica TaxID=3242702 RepID=A0ABV4U5T1_9BACT
MMKKILVTGGAGKAGRATVQELLAYGYEVQSTDLVRHGGLGCPEMRADLTDLGQAIDVLKGFEAVVHLAAIPGPGIVSDVQTFHINTTSTYNVFSAAATLNMKRVVWASSETTLGLPFPANPPAYAPVDEAHPLTPHTTYALSKVVGEELARQFSRWSGIPIVGLRFSNIMEPADYARFPSFQADPELRAWNLWGYVDARDMAQSCRLALEADLTGASAFIIAAADTVMTRPSAELLAERFPQTELRGLTDSRATLLSIDAAKQVLGYRPAYSWTDHVEPAG